MPYNVRGKIKLQPPGRLQRYLYIKSFQIHHTIGVTADITVI